MLLGYIAFGDGQEAREPALRGEHVVEGAVESALGGVVADREEESLRVEQHPEVGVLPHLARDVRVETQTGEKLDAERTRILESRAAIESAQAAEASRSVAVVPGGSAASESSASSAYSKPSASPTRLGTYSK